MQALEKISSELQSPAVISLSIHLNLKESQKSRSEYSAEYQKIVDSIVLRKGYPILIAAGNNRERSREEANVPINLKGVWPIGNVIKKASVWHFFTKKAHCWRFHGDSALGGWIKFVAPGTNVKVIRYDLMGQIESRVSGTSMSAPHAAAFFARLLSLFPWMKITDIEIAIDYILSDRQLPYSPMVPEHAQVPILNLEQSN